VADTMAGVLSSLSEEQQGDRLQRLERSMLRLERVGLETLAALQTLVNALKGPPKEGPP
jgi:hypothetical protein